ncbi:hypothetical protein FACS1894120_6370 [Clostridia bacterium]|nr:hypothetical protein FACS1894120_6370 [Clostridia bacterium]
MKVLSVAIKKTYRLSCPNCGSKLEAEIDDISDIGGKVFQFFCPVCNENRYISWSELRKKITYE